MCTGCLHVGGLGALYICVPSRVDIDKMCGDMQPICDNNEEGNIQVSVRGVYVGKGAVCLCTILSRHRQDLRRHGAHL